MQRTYEVMFIVRPDILDEDLDKLIAGLEANITQGGGSIKSMEKLGRRKLAYTVKKFNDGNYVLLTVDADGKLVAELERRPDTKEDLLAVFEQHRDRVAQRLATARRHLQAIEAKIAYFQSAVERDAGGIPRASSG